VPLDRSRLLLAAFAVAMFVLSFTPAPIRPIDVIQPPQRPAPGRSVQLDHSTLNGSTSTTARR
jgi:hypothetical protein